MTAARKPSEFDGTTISLSAFSWANRPPGKDARSHVTKLQVSLTPEIKIRGLYGRCPAGMQALATWALLVVPAGVLLRGPDMSWDMRLYDVFIETPVVGLSVPLG